MNKKIFIIDDDVVFCKALQRWLRKSGYSVSVAHDGESAFPMIESETPDLLLMDVLLPGMDGAALCRKIQQTGGISHIPIILMSAIYKGMDFKNQVAQLVVAFLEKPCTKEQILAEVKKVLPLPEEEDRIVPAPAVLTPDMLVAAEPEPISPSPREVPLQLEDSVGNSMGEQAPAVSSAPSADVLQPEQPAQPAQPEIIFENNTVETFTVPATTEAVQGIDDSLPEDEAEPFDQSIMDIDEHLTAPLTAPLTIDDPEPDLPEREQLETEPFVVDDASEDDEDGGLLLLDESFDVSSQYAVKGTEPDVREPDAVEPQAVKPETVEPETVEPEDDIREKSNALFVSDTDAEIPIPTGAPGNNDDGFSEDDEADDELFIEFVEEESTFSVEMPFSVMGPETNEDSSNENEAARQIKQKKSAQLKEKKAPIQTKKPTEVSKKKRFKTDSAIQQELDNLLKINRK